MTYNPSPIDTNEIELPPLDLGVVEKIAKHVHETWANARISEGWTYGIVRNDNLKIHPCLVPYEELPESEKDYDRRTATETLKVIHKLGYKLVPIE